MTTTELLALAEEDRFALVFDEKHEHDVMKNVREIAEACPTTGILVRQRLGGTAYHLTSTENVEDIERNGLRVTPEDEEFATYGGGVLYAYPSLGHYKSLDTKRYAIYRVEYCPGILRAIVTYDKDEQEQGELLIPAECIVSFTRVDEHGWTWEESKVEPGGVHRMHLG